MEPEKKSRGVVWVLIAIIVIILIVSGIYISQSGIKNIEYEYTPTTETEIKSEELKEIDALEADLMEVDTETGVDINAIY
ncbi:hypothetical protein A3D42_02380 [Candidatus Nomurabacteria bacterium RIFCSPHIGHO2_02_FULL_41_18]|uniref:Uncharacterized protein n=1 Tax=Candidatus Nomurabacteria bacterium RIFCSPHIGHO2_02_FULL_41_18 TaxID=1801754 RepID=A0A1F6W4U2_9BACT|nr:MAG: hypothetical protein A2737_01965 [Candidatus Nomurabacteria bacterium RIFCSPHIGHO2_01_FULL_41_71]OGI76957.1 MAG: hypothetical protein A3D42_02380 [Candidatus Nomurabacteria bacterium RIFCSPHIGHO2_02_FULL_41_18]OGI89467.1 MAG: hypothetical protein A3B01_01085 [Candidatus Nomurabacteria bacterium RIFCSPLOWO2_01_FULL_41_52b]OGJ00495.1 MAG: hypothetical protein A3I90_03100 [Candidatus Nomurabacteria bacterium RIFCSPLOWO2_02_FULL_41_9]